MTARPLPEKAAAPITASASSRRSALRGRKSCTAAYAPPTAAPRKYDIVLYRVRDEYVLHRIIGFDGDNYIICGDNCRGWERGHGRGDIIAVVDEIYRNGKPEKPHCLKNRIYERLWCSSMLKRIVMKLKAYM